MWEDQIVSEKDTYQKAVQERGSPQTAVGAWRTQAAGGECRASETVPLSQSALRSGGQEQSAFSVGRKARVLRRAVPRGGALGRR